MFLYNFALYCDGCGKSIIASLCVKGKKQSEDSQEWPQYAIAEQNEADSPQHCDRGQYCLEAITLPSGKKIGELLGMKLTSEGVEYLRLLRRRGKDKVYCDEEVLSLWENEFSDYL